MTNPPEQPFSDREYPPLEQSRPPVDPYAPLDYPTGYPPLPPPVYPQPRAGFPSPYPGYPSGYPMPYPGYPVDPYDPYRTTRVPGTNGKAIGALVASLVGLLFCGLPSIAGLILGIIAMRETKRTGQDGNGMALAAVIIGGLATAMWLLVLFFWVLGAAVAVNTPA